MEQFTQTHHRVLFMAQDGLRLYDLPEPFVIGAGQRAVEIFPAAPVDDVQSATRDLVRSRYVKILRLADGGDVELDVRTAESVVADASSWSRRGAAHEIWATESGLRVYGDTYSEFGGDELDRRLRKAIDGEG